MKCPKCNTNIQPGQIQCAKCGTKFKTQTCPHCHSEILANLPRCPRCKKEISAPPKVGKGSKNARKPLTKRWWFWAAAVVLVIGIAGNLGNKPSKGTGAPSPEPSAASSVSAVSQTEDNVFLSAPVQEGDVMNGVKTEKIGTWGYIKLNKADAKSASSEDYAAFAREVVDGSGYNWFSMLFEDGTGITFSGSYTYLATYGTLDEEGCIVDALGDISLSTKTGVCSYLPRKAGPTASPQPEATVKASPTPKATAAPAATKAPEPAKTPDPTKAPEPTQAPAPTQAPQPEATDPPQDSSQPAAPDPNNRAIYITPTGKRYHYDNKCNGGTYIESTLEEALAKGLTPCNKCVQN